MKRRPIDYRLLVAGGIITSLAVLTAAAWARKPAPLQTVPYVDLPRYMGDWKVIAEIPYFAEKNCVDSIESYALRPDGTIDNWFTARKKSLNAPQKRIATARAYVVDRKTNADWRVTFAWGLVRAKYLILDLDPEYQWAVVGHPSRNYGWILAREKTLPRATLRGIYERLHEQGYDLSRFRIVPQFPEQLEQPNAATKS